MKARAEKHLSIDSVDEKSTSPSKDNGEEHEMVIHDGDEPIPTDQSEFEVEMYVVDDSGNMVLHSKKIMNEENVQLDDKNNWVHDQFSSQILEMAGTMLMSNDITEQMAIEIKNKTLGLSVALIPGDGFCLFGALAHQLFRHPINSTEHQESTMLLKSEVVKYILDNFEFFEFILKRSSL